MFHSYYVVNYDVVYQTKHRTLFIAVNGHYHTECSPLALW